MHVSALFQLALYLAIEAATRECSIPADVLVSAAVPERPVHSMSFAQLMNNYGCQCDFFVSHCWSHPFTKTLVALDSSAKRCEDVAAKNVAFWICLFALNQHDLSGELAGCELARMPFAYGLSKALRGAVMVLDERAEPFRRIWCLYEAKGGNGCTPKPLRRESEVQRAWELAKDLRLISDCQGDRGLEGGSLTATRRHCPRPEAPRQRAWKSRANSRSLSQRSCRGLVPLTRAPVPASPEPR